MSTAEHAVVLWDIDGTLLTTGRAGIFAWEEALQEVCGVEEPLEGFKTSGLTDAAIAARLIETFAPGSQDRLVDLLRAYERRLPASLHRRRGSVLDGVLAILEDLAARDDVTCLLLTGNTPAGAAAKLAHYGLAAFFPGEGAFCEGGASRDEIAARALELARDRAGETLSPDRVFVVGDTPHDISCGRSIGARTVAVATGAYAVDELREERPWLVLERLPDPASFRKLLGIGLRSPG